MIVKGHVRLELTLCRQYTIIEPLKLPLYRQYTIIEPLELTLYRQYTFIEPFEHKVRSYHSVSVHTVAPLMLNLDPLHFRNRVVYAK